MKIEVKHILTLLLFLTYTLGLFAHDKTVDSLKAALKNAKHNITRINILSELSEVCEIEDILLYAEPCVKFCEKCLATPTARTRTPKVFYLKHLAGALNNIGFLANMQGDIPKALEYFHRSLKIQEEIKDKLGIANSLISIGFIYENQGDIPKALEYYHRSLKINEEIKDLKGIAYSLNSIGVIYNNRGDMLKALKYYHRSLKIREEIKEKQGIAHTLNNIGVIYHKQGDIPKALEYYHSCLKIQEEIKDKNGIANSLINISEAMLQKELVDGSLDFAVRSLQTAKELGYPATIKNAARILKKIYKKQDNFVAALDMYELEIQMRDSINNAETKKASVRKQFQYQYEKKASADSVKNAEEQKVKNAQLTAQQAQLKQEKTQRFALYGGLLLVVTFSGFVFNRFKITQRQKGIIEKQKGLVDLAYVQLHEKNKEITDSILYARRIQNCLLTPIKYIDNKLNRLTKGGDA